MTPRSAQTVTQYIDAIDIDNTHLTAEKRTVIIQELHYLRNERRLSDPGGKGCVCLLLWDDSRLGFEFWEDFQQEEEW